MTTSHHDPYAHEPTDAKWAKSQYSGDGNGACVLFTEWPNRDMWISDDKIPLADRTYQAYRPDERMAVLKAIVAGSSETPFVLTEAERQELLALVEANNPGLQLTR